MSEVKVIYLGESGTHFILHLSDKNGFIGIAEQRKARATDANKYYYNDEENRKLVADLTNNGDKQ